MKFFTQLLATLCIGLHLFGCGSDSTPRSVETTQQSTSTSAPTKWTVHAEMMVHLRTAEQAVAAFNPSEDPDYPTLAAKLQEALALLTSNCTMTGEAHDALHEWLLPYIELVNNLSDAPDEAASAEIFHKIESAFEQLNVSFI